MPKQTDRLAPFVGQRVLNLESYKKDGSPVRTPVVFVEEGEKLYFQTALKAWKARRVMRNPSARVAPSTFRVAAKGDWVSEVAKLDGDEAARVRKIYNKRFGLITRMFYFFEGLRWGKIAFFSIKPEAS